MRISDLLDPDELAEAIDQGYVRMQTHPTEPLVIYNYTERAVFDRAWSDVTRICRGLIVRGDGTVTARPFSKFFNFAEHPEGSFDLDARIIATDKLDGSLAILHPTSGGYAVATRGSFTSEQAQHATKIWQERYAATTEIDKDVTWLFEIIYPGNRIVCDYGDMDDLVLLGGVEIETGRPMPPGALTWSGPVAFTFPYVTLAAALAAAPRNGAEGLVLRFPDADHLMIKLKQDDYVALHKIIIGLNARAVWERLGAGETPADICRDIPDELHAWVKDRAAELSTEASTILTAAEEDHQAILAGLPDGWSRKDYAIVASKRPNRAWLFMLLDGKDPKSKIWRTLRPSGDDRPVNYSEDTA